MIIIPVNPSLAQIKPEPNPTTTPETKADLIVYFQLYFVQKEGGGKK